MLEAEDSGSVGSGGAAHGETRDMAAELEEEGDEVPLGTNAHLPSKLRLQTPVSSISHDNAGAIAVIINSFEKKGDGINAYIVYKIVTKVSGVAGFSRDNYEVWRRFSDFLGLHEKLMEKYLCKGVVLPPPPEKSIAAFTRTKASSEEGTREVATARCRLLQRFLSRLTSHPSTRGDCDLRDFLTLQTELPRASNTAALSSASVKKMLKSVGEAFSKMAVHMEEGDRWFEQTQSQMEELEEGVKRMHTVADGLAGTRRELKTMGDSLSKALSMLASCEESTALARALSHLTETEEGIACVWEKQAEEETAELLEALAEYVGLFNSLKNVFSERHRLWHSWQSAQQNITRKREQKTRLELAGKTEKAAALRQEAEEAMQKADELEGQFGRLSDTIRVEVARFEESRKKDLRHMLVVFLESLIVTQTEMLKLWQRFKPETESIMA